MDSKSVTSNTFRFFAHRKPQQSENLMPRVIPGHKGKPAAQGEASADMYMSAKNGLAKRLLDFDQNMFLAIPKVGKDDKVILESQPEVESPIRAQIPRRILTDAKNRRPFSDKPVLEFRRKKVIRAEDKKVLQLLTAHNYTQDFTKEIPPPVKMDAAKFIEENIAIKKIRKSAILRKVQNFWDQKSVYYPTVFKKLQKAEDDPGYYLELQDLTKEQSQDAGKFHPIN